MKYWETKSYRVFSWLLVLGYMALIFRLSAQPDVHLPEGIPNVDKVLHLLEYSGLAFLLAHAIPGAHHRKRFWLAWVIAVLYAGSDEIHQYFVPPRTCDFFDWLADATGSWIGAWLYLKSESIWRKTK